MVQTLSQYYQSQGQNLPSVQQRQSLAGQAGIQGYTGTAQQNTQLLGYLQQNGLGTQANNIPTIPIQTGTGNVQPLNLPNQPTSNLPDQLSGQAGGAIQPRPIQAQPVQRQSTGNYKQDFLGMIDSISSRPGELAQEYNIQQLQADFNKAKAGYDSTELSYRRQEEATTTNPALSADAKQARLGEIGRKKASHLADIAIDYQLKQGLYTGAKELMNQQLALELEPMKMKADFYKDMFMKTEDQKFQRLMKQEDRAYETAREEGKLLNDFKLQAYKDGKIGAADMSKIKSWDDFSMISGIEKVDALAEAGARSTIQVIDDALANKRGLRGAVGVGLFSRSGLLRGKVKQAFLGNVEQIAGQLTIDKLIAAKSSGATFGALSDGEQRLLAASSSRLGSWAKRDDDGRIIGWKVGEGEVKKELQKIKDFAILDYERRTGQPYTPPTDAMEYNGIALPGTNTGSTYGGIALPN